MKKYVIIVAGGSGLRMNSQIPKQFLEIADKPVLMHTLQKFHDFSPDIFIILVLPALAIVTWEELVEKHHFKVPFTIAKGGETRFESVKNGLALVPGHEESLIAIHDGVRPLVPVEVIAESFEIARTKGCAIAAVALKDSVRQLDENGGSTNLERSKLRQIQTPQTFRSNIIKYSFQQATHDEFTDDASVAEHAGFEITLIEGSYQNIKITTPEDLLIAEAFLKIEQS
jgi:2-C-methyl-D-erythritol 4-phosphate cytidylyltransferase